MKHYILNLWFLSINRSISEWICPKRQKKRRLVYVMTTYLRQHGLMSFISLNIPEREINLHFVNSAGLQQNAPFCVLLKFVFIFSWFYHTIFKALTTQILYPKCSRMHHFAFPTAFSLSRVGMYDWFSLFSEQIFHTNNKSSNIVVL